MLRMHKDDNATLILRKIEYYTYVGSEDISILSKK